MMHNVNYIQYWMKIMHQILHRLDLNLLLVFEAMLRLRSVAAVADELAITPSAISHALGRLRSTLSDELFVRVGHTMQPTALAEHMAGPVSAALDILSRGLSQSHEFDPLSSDRSFVIAATDYTAFAVLPYFIACIQAAAPRLRFKIIYSRGRESVEDLAAGRIDFALAAYVEGAVDPAPGIESFDWLEDEFVIIASRNHPTIHAELSLEQYLEARHVVVTPWNEATSSVGEVLGRLGLQRDIAVQLPSLLAAPFIIARSAMIMTVPYHAAKILQESAPISIYPAPFPIPRFTMKIYEHIRHSRTQAHVWIREQMLSAKMLIEDPPAR